MKLERLLIVEDEVHSRHQLELWLNEMPNVGDVRSASGLNEARSILETFDPSIVFLDIELGDGNGFDLISSVLQAAIVFTTAYEIYAVRAFRVNAIDYILKPFDKSDVEKALDRASERFQSKAPVSTIRELLTLKHNGVMYFLAPREISLVRSEDYYSAVQVGKRRFLTRKSISELTDQLHQFGFERVHRSTIINLAMVTAVRSKPSGGLEVDLADGSIVTVSRSYSQKVKSAIAEKSSIQL